MDVVTQVKHDITERMTSHEGTRQELDQHVESMHCEELWLKDLDIALNRLNSLFTIL